MPISPLLPLPVRRLRALRTLAKKRRSRFCPTTQIPCRVIADDAIDEEISAPELVKARTLCPHQDFVYAVTPLSDEETAVREHDARVD